VDDVPVELLHTQAKIRHCDICIVGRASSLSRQGSHGGIMDAFADMLAVRGVRLFRNDLP
jgi:hypothetical protein